MKSDFTPKHFAPCAPRWTSVVRRKAMAQLVFESPEGSLQRRSMLSDDGRRRFGPRTLVLERLASTTGFANRF
jgi:hypothetical protein